MKLAALLPSIFKASAQPVVGGAGYGGGFWHNMFFGGAAAKSDIHVDEFSALKLTSVYRCVRVVADTIAHLPLHVKKDGEKQREDDRHYLLHLRPNPYMGSFTLFQTIISHMLLWGNAYVEIERMAGGNKILGLHVLHPWQVSVMKEDGVVFYIIKVNGQNYRKEASDIIHLKNLGCDGFIGLSCISLHRQAVMLGMEQERFSNEFFKSSASSGGFLTHPTTLSEEARKNMKESWAAEQGKPRAIRLLEEGVTFTPNSIPPEDAQFLESRVFQVLEVARMFGVPPVLLFEQSKNTSWGTGIEQTVLGFFKMTLQPLIVHVEQELNYKLFSHDEQLDGLGAAFSMGGLLRGDMAARAAFYRTLFEVGALNSNEIREYEDMPAYEGGNQFRAPMNTEPTGVRKDA